MVVRRCDTFFPGSYVQTPSILLITPTAVDTREAKWHRNQQPETKPITIIGAVAPWISKHFNQSAIVDTLNLQPDLTQNEQ